MAEKRMRAVELVTLGVLSMLILVILALLLASCVPAPTPGLNYEATLAYVEAGLANCEGELFGCMAQPTQTPHVIVVTPIPPTPMPVTATPPYPGNLVKCDEAPIGTTLYVTTRTTVRYWHAVDSNNLGQAEAGEAGKLIDKSKDANGLWWWRAEGLRTNDHPYGVTGWVKASVSACVPPKN